MQWNQSIPDTLGSKGMSSYQGLQVYCGNGEHGMENHLVPLACVLNREVSATKGAGLEGCLQLRGPARLEGCLQLRGPG